MDAEAAVAAGAMALFGEKYGDEVRVVSMGRAMTATGPTRTSSAAAPTSRRTGDIGLFKIVCGKRGGGGRAAHRGGDRRGGARSTSPSRNGRLKDRRSCSRPRRPRCRRGWRSCSRSAAGWSASWPRRAGRWPPAAAMAPSNATSAACASRRALLDGVPARELKGLADDMKKQVGSGVVALVGTSDGKASLVVGVTDDLTAGSAPSTSSAIGAACARRQGRRRPRRHGPGGRAGSDPGASRARCHRTRARTSRSLSESV